MPAQPTMQKQLTLLQYIFLIHGTQVAVGVLSLPRQLAEGAGTDGWIALFFGWGASIIASLLIISAMKPYPGSHLPDVMGLFFGQWGKKLGVIVSGVYFTTFAFIMLVKTVLYIKNWMLQETSQFVIMSLLLLPAIFIVPGGFKVLGRYTELVYFLKIMVIVILIFPLIDGHFINLLPVLKEGWGPVLKTVNSTVLSFLGFEVAYFCYPALTTKQYAVRGILIANTLTLFLYLFVTIVCFVHFSPDEITQYNDPPLTVLKTIELRYVERFDVITLAFYLFVLATSWMPFMYIGVYCTGMLTGKQKPSGYFVGAIVCFVLVTFFLNPSFENNDQLVKFISYFGLCFAYALPVFLWAYSRVHQRMKRRSSA
ncbi:GerAB/ArcD/ProY family transporter [Paenibacillus rigui]|uniref:Spore gernimation protein n=1 Tax=Paenibacillus rigui TaxID=554312 RepID=A0A229UIZ5_9BACL|nr:endospore germination permease [Paenibacillus rigui]OXM83255.1 spore gernimation protein [Paenibacillus rigui]